MKGYTDLEQSRKLAEFLPIESADQTWARIAIAGANLNVPEELQYRHNGDMPFQYYSGIGIPCWSLSVLLGLMPFHIIENNRFGFYQVKGYNKQGETYRFGYKTNNDSFLFETSWYNDVVDAAFEMICWLRENGKI